MTIKELLKNNIDLLKSKNIDNAVLKTRVILSHILGLKKEELLIHDNDEIESKIVEKMKNSINQLSEGKPLQYITNHQEFMKLNFYVDENVLVPRADTEILVEEVINICNENINKQIDVLDLCTGSGIIGISIAKYVENSHITQSDISSSALEIVKKNANVNNVEKKIDIICSDMFEKIDKKFNIITSNPPYIKTKVISILDTEVQNEPHIALDGGEDGLDFYRILIDNAYQYLNKNGYLCLEIGYDQKDELIELLEKSNNYDNIYSKKDLYQNDRIIVAKKL